jgi:uncharacterized iron-regulated membrane protein
MTGDWTDANVHDPGITVLEVLAFVLTAAIVGGVFWRWRRRRHVRPSAHRRGH